MSFEVIPAPGSSHVEIADRGFTARNSEIVMVKYDMPWYYMGGYHRSVAHDLGVNMPEIRLVTETPKGTQVYTKRPPAKRVFYEGSSPIKQAIDWKIREYNSMEKLVTAKQIAKEVAEDVHEDERRIHLQILRMHDKGQIFMSPPPPDPKYPTDVRWNAITNSYVKPGFRELAVKRKYRTDVEVGKAHPVKDYIFKFVKREGRATYRDIENEMKRINWIKRPKTLKGYLKEMVRDGNLKEEVEGYYEAGLPV